MATITITPGWAGPASAVGTNPIVVQVAGVGPPGAAGTSGVAPSGTGIVTVTSGTLGTPGPLTGDVTTTAGGLATTLATVNSNVGSFTNATVTVNAKGLVTAASSGAAGGITIGDTVTSGTSGRVLYVGAGPVLAQDAGLTYDPATDTLTGGRVQVGGAGASTVALQVVTDNTVGTPGSGVPVAAFTSFSVTGATDTAKRMMMAFDTTFNYGIIGAGRSGYSWYDTHIQPSDSLGVPVLSVIGGTNRVGVNNTTPTAHLTIRKPAGSENLTEWQNSSSTVVASVLPPSSGGTTTMAFPPLTPSQITSNQNNYAPGVARYYRLSTDASRDITGLSCSQVSGQECEIWNVGSFPIVLKHQDANSTAANRFLIDTGADLTIQPNSRVELRYDSTQSRWVVASPAGLAIGDTVTSGTSGRVLYVGSGPVLAQDAGLTYDPATDTLTSGPVVAVGTVTVRQPGGTPGQHEFTLSTDGSYPMISTAGGGGNAIYFANAGTTIVGFNYSTRAIQIGSNASYQFTSGTNPAFTGQDTGLARPLAKVVGLTDGSTGGGTLSSVPLTPSQITANQNNYAPGVARYYRLSTDASRDITGLSCSQVSGQECEIWNVGSNNIVIKHQDANSTAANRFICTGAADITLAADEIALLRYDSTTSRWRVRKI